ncbi:hypothetical protein KFE25_001648 [Diacronema lutheri]|uniref:PNPLA domain-containing protein n=2 Tax=Diacronema lutheri TaxID=2081491 RepID=A0A8J6CAQ9_DIALT|nr:hypothetical protein KFE25_001648 [Diacronema lutheri]
MVTKSGKQVPNLIVLNNKVRLGLALNATTSRAAAQKADVPKIDASLPPLELDMWLTDGVMHEHALPEAGLLRNAPGETTGICFTGGGSRAATSVVGFLRGLVELGLIEHVDFVSACSGGAYALIPFQYYAAGPTDDFQLLGPVIPAEELVDEALSRVPEHSLLNRLAVPIFSRFAAELFTPSCMDGSEADEAWGFALAQCFLKPYGLADPQALVAADDAHAERIRARNPKLAGARIYTRRPGRPFDICTTTLGPPTRPPAARARAVVWNTEDFTPFDMTSLYCGSPLARNHSFATCDTFARTRDPTVKPDAVSKFELGGFVETFAVGRTLAPADGLPRAPAKGGTAPVRVVCRQLAGASQRGLSLTKMLELTSNAYCGVTNNTGAREQLLELAGLDIANTFSRLAYWSPTAVASAASAASAARAARAAPAPTSSVFVLDAGGHDLAAILPMLARSVRRVVAFLSLGVQMQTGFPLDGGASGVEWKGKEGDLDGQLPAYFGVRATSCEHLLHSLKHVQVFAPADFWRLMRAVREKLVDGDYPIVEMEHNVLANPFWGIKGGYKVRVCWVVLQRVPRWEARLPDALRASVERDCAAGTGEFRNFPNYSVYGQNDGNGGLDMHMTVRQTHLASQLATSYVLQHEAVFRRMLGPRAPEPAPDEPGDRLRRWGACGKPSRK